MSRGLRRWIAISYVLSEEYMHIWPELLTRETHVGHDVTLSALHRRHPFEQELATHETHGGQEPEDAHHVAILAGHAVAIIEAVLLAILLRPTLRGYAAKDHHREELEKSREFPMNEGAH